MALYLEHCIKYGATVENKLDKIGPGDLMSQLIQFMQTFVVDACQGTAREGATAEARRKWAAWLLLVSRGSARLWRRQRRGICACAQV